MATVIALAAVATMIALGFWQLQRKAEKEALLRRYAAAAEAAPLQKPQRAAIDAALLYRRIVLECRQVGPWRAVSGRNAADTAGIAHVTTCTTPHGVFDLVAGWSASPAAPDWSGGPVTGTLAPGGPSGIKVVADPPLGGLQANARPDPGSIPNNHLGYALQWFFFALAALVIFALALRKRLAAADAGG